MRMLMGANGIYADGKAQPMASNGNVFFFWFIFLNDYFIWIELSTEQSNKRAASPNDKSQSLEYLIRGELIRACPTTLPKNDGKIELLKKNTNSLNF
jgi:hypothetical protein